MWLICGLAQNVVYYSLTQEPPPPPPSSLTHAHMHACKQRILGKCPRLSKSLEFSGRKISFSISYHKYFNLWKLLTIRASNGHKVFFIKEHRVWTWPSFLCLKKGLESSKEAKRLATNQAEKLSPVIEEWSGSHSRSGLSLLAVWKRATWSGKF